jgi:hypothetical protein
MAAGSEGAADKRGARRPAAPLFWKAKHGEAICGRPPPFGTRYIPGVFTCNSMLKRLAFLSGLLSPQSPSIEPPPVAP